MSYPATVPTDEGKEAQVLHPEPCTECGNDDFSTLHWLEDQDGNGLDAVGCEMCGHTYLDDDP